MRYVVETDRLQNNLAVLRRELAGVPLIAVLKCNGYGLGLTGTALRLWEEGVTDFAVLRFDEAAAVRALLPEDAIDTMIASLPSIFFEYLMAESWLPEVLTSPESTGWPGVQTSFFRS